MLPAPAASGIFPTLSLRILPWMPGPLPRRSMECICLFLPPCHRPSPVHYEVGFPFFPAKRFHDGSFSRLQPFLYVQASGLLASQVAPYRCRLFAAGQPRLLRPSRTCFVASACIGYAIHPPRQLTDGDFHPTDSQPCRLLQCNEDLRQLSYMGLPVRMVRKGFIERHRCSAATTVEPRPMFLVVRGGRATHG